MQSRQTSRKVAVRHGSIRGPGFSAVEYRGTNPAFKGRIAVERGSGMVEFPSAEQIRRILREEGIAASAADAAFGHMRGARRTSRKSKKNGGPKSLSTALSAYGGRSTAIGHMGVVGGLAMPVAGLRRGSLLAFVKPTKHIIVNFEANDGDAKNEKPIRWGREWPGGDSPGGRAATWDDAYRKAQEFGIPEEAFLRAFGYMVSAKRRRQIAASLAQSASGKIFEPE